MAAVDNIETGDRDSLYGPIGEIIIQRKVFCFCRSPQNGDGSGIDGIAAKFSLIAGSIQINHNLVNFFLIMHILSDQSGSDDLIDVVDGMVDTQSVIFCRVVVSKYKRLKFAHRRSGGGTSPSQCAVFCDNIDFYHRTAFTVYNLAGVDRLDF